jgi:Zn-finger nucleic acid-binding protein
VEAEGVALNGCIGCGGVWVANACAQRILEKPLPIFDELARRAAANARGRFVRAERPACPICDATLDAVTVAAIPLDVCAAHGTWFDGNELALLVSALLRAKPGTPIASRVGTVSCVGCRVELAESAANIGVRGPTCDACFRQYTRQLIAEADAKHGQRQTIGGVLALGLAAALLGGARGSRS